MMSKTVQELAVTDPISPTLLLLMIKKRWDRSVLVLPMVLIELKHLLLEGKLEDLKCQIQMRLLLSKR